MPRPGKLKAGDTVICVTPHVFRSHPKDHRVAKGELLEVEGFLRGDMLVLKLDPVKHPSGYKHLRYCACGVEARDRKHFKLVKENND